MKALSKLMCALLLVGSQYVSAFEMEPDISSDLKSRAIQASYGISKKMTMDIYGLEKGYKNAPVLVMVHGGAWRLGDKANRSVVENKMPYFVNKGYVFVSVNYDLVPVVNPIEQAVEVLKAVSFLQKNADKYSIDPTKMVLMGHSAGAHLAALATTSSSVQSRVTLSAPISSVVLLDSAALDIPKIMDAEHVYPFYKVAFGSDPNFWRDASPIFKVRSGVPPMMLICSKQRRESCEQAYSFKQKSEMFGNKALFYPIDFNHGEISTQIGLHEEYTRDVHGFIGQFTGR